MASIDRNSPLPLYIQLKQILQDRIDSAEWRLGDQIPGEQELQDQYNLSRITVRQALSELVNDGRLVRYRGRGTFVALPKVVHNPAVRTGLSDNLRQQGLEPAWRVLNVIKVTPSPHVSAHLRIAEGETALRIKRLRLADDGPIGVHSAYVPLAFAAAIHTDLLTEGGSLRYLRHLPQFDGHRVQRTLEAVAATEAEAKLLRTDIGAPLLLIERLIVSADNTPIEFLRAVYCGDRFKYHVTM